MAMIDDTILQDLVAAMVKAGVGAGVTVFYVGEEIPASATDYVQILSMAVDPHESNQGAPGVDNPEQATVTVQLGVVVPPELMAVSGRNLPASGMAAAQALHNQSQDQTTGDATHRIEFGPAKRQIGSEIDPQRGVRGVLIEVSGMAQRTSGSGVVAVALA